MEIERRHERGGIDRGPLVCAPGDRRPFVFRRERLAGLLAHRRVKELEGGQHRPGTRQSLEPVTPPDVTLAIDVAHGLLRFPREAIHGSSPLHQGRQQRVTAQLVERRKIIAASAAVVSVEYTCRMTSCRATVSNDSTCVSL